MATVSTARPQGPPALADLSAVAGYLLHLWTFFGSVAGLALASTSSDLYGRCYGRVRLAADHAIVRLAKTHNITSIADFIAARYGKDQTAIPSR
jgi:Na+/proline symporter